MVEVHLDEKWPGKSTTVEVGAETWMMLLNKPLRCVKSSSILIERGRTVYENGPNQGIPKPSSGKAARGMGVKDSAEVG